MSEGRKLQIFALAAAFLGFTCAVMTAAHASPVSASTECAAAVWLEHTYPARNSNSFRRLIKPMMMGRPSAYALRSYAEFTDKPHAALGVAAREILARLPSEPVADIDCSSEFRAAGLTLDTPDARGAAEANDLLEVISFTRAAVTTSGNWLFLARSVCFPGSKSGVFAEDYLLKRSAKGFSVPWTPPRLLEEAVMTQPQRCD